MFNIFISVFSFVVLCFQGAYAETANDFKKHLDCFKALKNRTYINFDRHASGYFENPNVVLLPDPSDSHTWLIVTESSIYQHKFEEKGPLMFLVVEDFFDSTVIRTLGAGFQLPLSNGQSVSLLFRYEQYFKNEPLQPSLSVVKSCCPAPSSEMLNPNNKTTTDYTINVIIDALRERIQNVYMYSERSYHKISQDDFITALNICTGIDDKLNFIIEQQKAKFQL